MGLYRVFKGFVSYNFFNMIYINETKIFRIFKFLGKYKTAQFTLFKFCPRDAERTGGHTDHIVGVIKFESCKNSYWCKTVKYVQTNPQGIVRFFQNNT